MGKRSRTFLLFELQTNPHPLTKWQFPMKLSNMVIYFWSDARPICERLSSTRSTNQKKGPKKGHQPSKKPTTRCKSHAQKGSQNSARAESPTTSFLLLGHLPRFLGPSTKALRRCRARQAPPGRCTARSRLGPSPPPSPPAPGKQRGGGGGGGPGGGGAAGMVGLGGWGVGAFLEGTTASLDTEPISQTWGCSLCYSWRAFGGGRRVAVFLAPSLSGLNYKRPRFWVKSCPQFGVEGPFLDGVEGTEARHTVAIVTSFLFEETSFGAAIF